MSTNHHQPARPKRVLLIGWDAADWQMMDPLIEAGEMPNLKRFVDEGVRGNIATLTPPLSPMLWTSIASGKTADKHGILGFAEPDGVSGKSRPVTSTGRTCKAIWNILSESDRPCGAINWFASHPAEQINGFIVSDRFAHPTGPLKPEEPDYGWSRVPESVWPEEDLEALASVRVHPQMISQEQVLEFIPSATSDESAGWDKVRELRALLAHCATVHNAATAYINERPWDFLGIYYDAIDRFAHAFMEYNAPKMEHIQSEDFDRYSGVMNACYRFHDLMLGRLMNMIDDETAVMLLSDHGFHSGKTRPRGTSGIENGQPAAWHRPYGAIAFWGPGIARGTSVYGASLLDVAPTILDMLGMAGARDMDGVPLMQIWEEPRLPLERIETYESEAPNKESLAGISDAVVDEQIMLQLRQLGYLGKDDAEAVTIDRKKNLAAVYQSLGKSHLAAQEYKDILALGTNTKGIRLALAGCLLGIGEPEKAADELQLAINEDGLRARHLALRSMIQQRTGNHEAALESIEHAIRMDDSVPGLYSRRGQLMNVLERWDLAEMAFEAALDRDPDDAEALDGIGVAYHHTNRDVEAVHAFTRSIALLRFRPSVHLHLGVSLVRVGRIAWAIESFSEAARLAPGDPTPHVRLHEIYGRVMKNKAKAAFHLRRAEMIRAKHAHRAAQHTSGQRAEPTARPSTRRATAQPSNTDKHASTQAPITVVSGLPRSGTSLMMQMLYAGGFRILHDDIREADESNPRGYFELEAVKHTASDDTWVSTAPGKAVKVIHALLRVLPPAYEYRVIFMKRDLEEVVSSQTTMLRNLDHAGTDLSPALLRAAYLREYERIGTWMMEQPNFTVMEVSYNRLIEDPEPWLERLPSLLGHPMDLGLMREIIDTSLYRERSGSPRR